MLKNIFVTLMVLNTLEMLLVLNMNKTTTLIKIETTNNFIRTMLVTKYQIHLYPVPILKISALIKELVYEFNYHNNTKKTQLCKEYRGNPNPSRLLIILLKDSEIKTNSDGNKITEIEIR